MIRIRQAEDTKEHRFKLKLITGEGAGIGAIIWPSTGGPAIVLRTK